MKACMEVSEDLRFCKNFKNKKPHSPSPHLVSYIRSFLLCHGTISGKQHYVCCAVAFLLGGGHQSWGLWLNPSAFTYLFFPWESRCLLWVLIFPKHGFLNSAWHPRPATAWHSQKVREISLFSHQKAWLQVISRQWCWPRDLRCSATEDPHVLPGWKRRLEVSLEIRLEKPEKQTYLCGSLEGLEAAVEAVVVVAGKKPMAKLWLRVCFRMTNVRNFWKPFIIPPTAITVNMYHAQCKCQWLFTGFISQEIVLFRHYCAWISTCSQDEFVLLPVGPGV